MKLLKVLCLLMLSVAISCAAIAQEEAEPETEPAPTSQLAGLKLPVAAVRILPGSVPATINQTLQAVIQADARVKQGRSEVLAWTGEGFTKARATQILGQTRKSIEENGWTYEAGDDNADVKLFTLIRAVPTPRALVGFWVPGDDALVLAWTEMLRADVATGTEKPDRSTPAQNNGAQSTPVTPPATAGAATVLEIGPQGKYVNVMKNQVPKIPAFPALEKKAGHIRGYVKDSKGNPLQGARIGVRSTAVGGAYSGASGKSDAKGYYEFPVPFGVAHFYAAGYTIDWGDGRAALGLHPADGEADAFASNVGSVENFVLLAYGIADRDKASEDPNYSGNYYGGTFTVSYSIADDRDPGSTDLPANSVVEITLTPDGPLIDDTAGQAFVIRKRIEFGGFFYVNNIPAARYRISARLVDGGPLTSQETGPYANNPFGLEPKTAKGNAILMFRPGGAQAEMAGAQRGHWSQVNLSLSR